MSSEIERTLADAIDEIRSGRKGTDDILVQPLADDPEFEPLLRLALSIKPPEEMELSPTKQQVLRARIMNDIAGQTIAGSKSSPSGLWNLWNPLSFARKAAIPAVVAVTILAMSAGGTIYAAQDSLPGDTLYGVKMAVEQAQVSLAPSPNAKVDSLMQSAQKRTEEITKEQERRPDDVEKLANSYESNVEQALQILSTMSDNDSNKERLAAQLLDNLERHQTRLEEVYDKAPSQAKGAILRAREKSRHGLETAAAMVAKEKERGKPGFKNGSGPAATPMQTPGGSSVMPTPAPTTTPGLPGLTVPENGPEKDDKDSPAIQDKLRPGDGTPKSEPRNGPSDNNPAPGKGPVGKGRN